MRGFRASNMPFLGYVGLNTHTGAFAIAVGLWAAVLLAVAVLLLAGAGLLGQSFYRLLHVPLGFDPNHLATVRVMAPSATCRSHLATRS